MRQILYTILMLPLLCPAASSPSVTLTETNGLAIVGKLLSYSSKTGLIKIRQEDKTASCSFPALTKESRQQVVLWQSDKNFQSRSNLDVTFQNHYTHSTSNIEGTVTDQMTNKKTEQTIGYEDRQFGTYNITITNESDTPFDDLIADYRIFFTLCLSDGYVGKYQLAGSETFETLLAGKVWNFSTTSFLSEISYRPAMGINWTGMPVSFGSNILGTWLHIRKRGLDGEWVERKIEDGEVPRNRDRSDYQKVYE